MAALAELSLTPAHRLSVDVTPFTDWPLLATPLPSGSPIPADDRIEQRLSLDHHLVRIPEATFLVRVTGDHLTEAGIHDGDLVVMDRAIPATEGSVVLALMEDEFQIAQVSSDADGQRVLCTADGGHWPLEAMVIVGVARWAVHRLWPTRHGSH